jgi:hypothetical protein
VRNEREVLVLQLVVVAKEEFSNSDVSKAEGIDRPPQFEEVTLGASHYQIKNGL